MSKKLIRAGGQAIIEGVMMLVDGGYAIAVRKKNNEIEIKSKPYTRWTKKNKFYGLPFIRGIVSFIEMMNIGLDSINKSAEIYYEEETGNSLKDKLLTVLTFIVAIAIGIGLFLFVPILLGNSLKLQGNQIYFNLFLGLMRMTFFIIYILIISLMKDIKRFFMYHGAEHKTVFTYENGEELTVENARKYSTKHPRCGTSFIFIVLITAIVFYAIFDTIIFNLMGLPNNPLSRLINHLILLPFVAAIAFEVLTLTGKWFKNIFVKILIMPGLLFQLITTKEPTDEMLEVAIASLNAALTVSETEKSSGNK